MLIVCPNSGIDIQYNLSEFSTHNRVNNAIKQPGGKGFNVLRVLKQLGNSSELITFTGKYNGRFIKDKSAIENLEVITIDIENDNRICLNIIGESNFEILESGPTIYENEVKEYVEEILRQGRNHDFMLLSGSEPNSYSSIYKKIVEESKSKIIIDTSGPSLFNCYNENIFGIKINNFEFEDLCTNLGIEGTIEDKMLKLNNDLVVVTLGSDGSIVKYYNDLYRVVIPNYVIINATGSGDSFFAGLCYGLVNNYNIVKILKLANACGILNALEEKTGYIDVDRIDEVCSGINIKKLR